MFYKIFEKDGFKMKNKFVFALCFVLVFGFVICGCDTGTNSPGGDPPVFTLTNIDATQQSEGSNWFIFGLFPKGTSDNDVLSDAKAHKTGTQPSKVIAYAGGQANKLSWQGNPPNMSISSKLTSASDHQSTWNSTGEYDGWVLVFNGTVWNGYKLTINVQGNVTKSAQGFTKTITNQS
jgi:hypothetical protein